MDQQISRGVAAAKSLPRWEFISLCAALMALNALAIDIMLPALQQIGASLGVENENARQYVITAYFAGMAFALLPYGPASDRFGRRPPLLFGLAVYVAAAIAAAFAPNFEVLLALRFVQGIGAASTRIVGGRVSFSGKEITNRDVRFLKELGIAHIPEDRHRRGLLLQSDLSENAILGVHYRAPVANAAGMMNDSAVQTRVEQIIKNFDVRPPVASLRAKALSGGNQNSIAA